MNRKTLAGLLLFAAVLLFAQFAFAAEQNSSNAQCPAPKPPTSVYAGSSKPATYTIPDPSDSSKTITVTNLSKKTCSQSCATDGGGTIHGTCTLKGSTPDCVTSTQCNGKPVQQATGSGGTTGSGSQSSSNVIELPPVEVSPDSAGAGGSAASQPDTSGTTDSGTTGGTSADTSGSSGSSANASAGGSTNTDSSGGAATAASAGNSTPSTNWTGAPNSSNAGGLSQYQNSLFNQALNSLEGTGGTQPPLSQTQPQQNVPTGEQQYLSSTFGTGASGGVLGSDNPSSNPLSGATAVTINNPINLNTTAPAAVQDPGWMSQSQLYQIAACDSCTLQFAKSDTAPNQPASFVVQAQPGQLSPGLASALGANGGWAVGTIGQQPTTPPLEFTSEPNPSPAPTTVADNSAPQSSPEQTTPPAQADQVAPAQNAAPASNDSSQAQTAPAVENGNNASQNAAAPSQNAASQTALPSNTGNTASAQTSPAPSSGQQPAAQGSGSGVAVSGGATGGTQNSGGANNVAAFLGGLLGGLAGSPAPAAASQPTTPIVAAPNQPLVALQTPSASGDQFTPCANSTQSNQQQTQNPCSTVSTAPASGSVQATVLPNPQLVSSIASSAAQGQSISGSSQNNVQTVIPGQTQNTNGNSGSQSTVQTAVGGTQPAQANTRPSQSSNPQQSAANQAGSSQPAQSSNQPSGAPASNNSANSNSAPASNPQGGQSGTPNPAGSQQGGSGAPASTPGNTSQQVQNTQQNGQTAQQAANSPSAGSGGQIPSSATTCTTFSCWATQQLSDLKTALQNPGQTLASIFSVGTASASEPTSIKEQAQRDLQIAQRGLDVAKNLWSQPNSAQMQILQGARAAAARLVSSVQQLGNGSLSREIASYVREIDSMRNPANQNLTTFNAVNATGDKVVSDVRNFLQRVPSASIAPIGTAATQQPTAVPIAANAIAEPNPNPFGNAIQNNVPIANGSRFTNTPAPVATNAGRVNVELPGQDQMGPITHDGMPIQEAQQEIGHTYYTRELTTFSDFKCASGTCPSNQLGIAHRTWPLGSQVEVCNTNNSQCAVATVIDRGPATWLSNRTIDANTALANQIGLNGLNPATYKLLSVPGSNMTAQASGVQAIPCNYKGCASPTPVSQVAAARVSGLTSVQNCANHSGLCASDPTTGASFTCAGDAASCIASLQQQLSLSRLCASNPSTCNASIATYSLRQMGQAQPAPEPRQIISVQSNYGTRGILAKNPNVPLVSGISSQDFISRMRAAGVNVQDMSGSSLSNYPHGMNQMALLTWHGSGTGGADSGLVSTEINQNNSGQAAAQMVLQRDGTLVVVAPVDALSFQAATTNAMGPGIEIQGLTNQGDNPTPAQQAAMQKITNVAMDQLGWEVGTHGQIEPGHRDSQEAGPSTIAYVYQGIAPGPQTTYQLLDQNGNPVVNGSGQPITTTQAPDGNGQGKFLTSADGTLQLDANGQPIPVNPVPLAQNPSDPTQYSAPDDRPAQPRPVNPWRTTAGNPYATTLQQNYCIVGTQPLVAVACSSAAMVQQPPLARPIQYASAMPLSQQFAQPYAPYNQLPAQAPPVASTSTPPVVALTIIASPTSVKSGGTSKITWSSVFANSCSVTTSGGVTISTSANGSVASPALASTTQFTLQCRSAVNGTTVATSTSVLVQ